MNILLLGSSGLLGNELNKILKRKNNLTNNGSKFRNKDLRAKKNIQELLLAKNYDLIINSAAITNINFCEKNKKLSKQVNVNILKNIFLIKKNFNLKFKFIQFSTDQVYNSAIGKFGKENSKVKILNEYTRQKIEAEKICRKNKALIFRTNFFAYKKKSLFKWVIDKAHGKEEFFLFNDIIFNPLRINTICKIIDKIITNRKFYNGGVFNLGAKDAFSKSKFGLEIIKNLKISNSNHKIISFKKILKTKRPSNMTMDINKFEKKFQINLPKLKNEIIDEINENVKNKN